MANKSLTILVDFDDTMIDMLKCWVSAINEQYGTKVNPKNINDWDIGRFFPTLGREQIFEPLFQNEFWSKVKPKNGAVNYIKKLKDDGHRIIVCTNSNYKTLKYKMDDALFRFFDYISWDDVIVTAHKQLIVADILIDDGAHNLIGGKYVGILMDAPHNRNFNEQEHSNIIRAKNWKEIYKIVNQLTQEDTNDNIILDGVS